MDRVTSPGSNQKTPLRAKSAHFNASKQSLYNGLPIADNSSTHAPPRQKCELLNQASKTSNTFESRDRLAKSQEKLGQSRSREVLHRSQQILDRESS